MIIIRSYTRLVIATCSSSPCDGNLDGRRRGGGGKGGNELNEVQLYWRFSCKLLLHSFISFHSSSSPFFLLHTNEATLNFGDMFMTREP